MGSFLSQYDPLTVYGRYNLKDYTYQNKRNVIVMLVTILIIIIGSILMIWSTDKGIFASKPSYSIPPPIYGTGPYGKGYYLPPAEILVNVVS